MKKFKQTRLKGFLPAEPSLSGETNSVSARAANHNEHDFHTPQTTSSDTILNISNIKNSEIECAVIPKISVEESNSEQRKFQEKWIEGFSWILYENGIVKCQFCVAAKDKIKSSTKFSQGFSGPFKHETFKYHDDSTQHKKNVDIFKKSKEPLAHTSLAKCVKRMDEKNV